MTAPIVDVHLTPDDGERSLRQDVQLGLTSSPKWLQPKWFYDARGSDLFEQITRLPEYYPTRVESSVLGEHAKDIARRTRAHALVELGSGSSDKTRLLLDALHEIGTLRQYVPLDVSTSALGEAVATIRDEYPGWSSMGLWPTSPSTWTASPGKDQEWSPFSAARLATSFRTNEPPFSVSSARP